MLSFLLTLVAAASAPADRPPPMHPHRPLIETIGGPAFDKLAQVNGMSPAGIAALHKLPAVASVDGPSAECAVITAAEARPLDVDRLDEALAAREAVAATKATRHHVALIAALRLLDDADAAIFLKLVGTGDHGGMPMGPPPGGMGGPDGPGGRRGKRGDGPPPGPLPGMNCPA